MPNPLEASLAQPSADPSSDPNTIAWLRKVLDAVDRLTIALKEGEAGTEDASVTALNLLVRCLLEIGEAGNAAGISPTLTETKAQLLKSYERLKPRDMDLGEKRAIAAAIYQREGFALTPEEDFPRFHTEPKLEDIMRAVAYMEGWESFDSAATVRKSIIRSRSKVRGQHLYRLNRENLTLHGGDAESLLFKGLANRRGRPRKKK